MTYRDIAPDKLTNGGGAGTRSLPGQAIGKPICLTGDIIKDLCEAQAFEPSRGPGAEVSLQVITVHNDRLVPLEHCGALTIELWQRDIDGPG
jgi:hypothetical protein